MNGNWLTEMLIAKGVMSESGLTRNAGIRTHRPCQTACVAGIDDSGFDTWCELREITRDGELQALLDGRHTWDLHAGRGLTVRGSLAIRHRPAQTPGRPVLVEHRCGQPIPASWIAPVGHATARPTTNEEPAW